MAAAVAPMSQACQDAHMRRFHSHGSGQFSVDELATLGEGVIFEAGVLIWHPETVHLGSNIYIGHGAMLKGYYKGQLTIESDTWIGQGVYFHAAGGIHIGPRVGIAPGVKIITSYHEIPGRRTPILEGEIRFAGVSIGADSDIGIGAIILPGVTIGCGVQVGAGAVVTKDVPDYAIAAGNPARIIRMREP